MIIIVNFLILKTLGEIDPSPFFVISLFPYILFLIWAQKSESIPQISLWGYRLTLIFVLMTIIFAILAKVLYGEELTDVDFLHGSAEAFLTLSDGLIAFGFIKLIQNKDVKNS